MRGTNLAAAMMVAHMALCARPVVVEDLSDEERKVPPPEPVKPVADYYFNRPGETNRQLAKRIAAERANGERA